jgi:PAS domain-containing protein
LEGQSKTQVEIVSGIVDARRREERMPAPAQFERGKQAMDAIRITVNEMEGAASRLLGERTQRVRSTRDLSGSLIACGSLLGVIFLSVAGVIVGREIGVSARARAQVRALNADLERRVMERTAALQESETNFRSVLACMSEGLVTTDEKGKFIIWNPAAERILGLGPVNMSSEEWSAHYGLFMPDTVTPFPPERNPLLLALQGEVRGQQQRRYLCAQFGAWHRYLD